jgi:hypothetical protein
MKQCSLVFLFCVHSLLAFKVPVPQIKFGYESKNIFKTEFSVKEVEVSLKNTLLSMAIIPFLLSSSPSSAFADEAKDVQVYWGVGCFWHTQHEFINAEKTLLGRTDEQLTVRIKSIYCESGPHENYGGSISKIDINLSKINNVIVNLNHYILYRAEQVMQEVIS